VRGKPTDHLFPVWEDRRLWRKSVSPIKGEEEKNGYFSLSLRPKECFPHPLLEKGKEDLLACAGE